MSDWFTNPSSDIPDEMWRAQTPMQRQADAAVLWAELTGKHASGCGSHGPSKPKKKSHTKKASSAGSNARRGFAAARGALRGALKTRPAEVVRGIARNPEVAGSAAGTVALGTKSYFDNREGKGGISKAERSLMGDIASAKATGAKKEKIDKLRRKLERAKYRRENLSLIVARDSAIGAGGGALTGFAARKYAGRGTK